MARRWKRTTTKRKEKKRKRDRCTKRISGHLIFLLLHFLADFPCCGGEGRGEEEIEKKKEKKKEKGGKGVGWRKA